MVLFATKLGIKLQFDGHASHIIIGVRAEMQAWRANIAGGYAQAKKLTCGEQREDQQEATKFYSNPQRLKPSSSIETPRSSAYLTSDFCLAN